MDDPIKSVEDTQEINNDDEEQQEILIEDEEQQALESLMRQQALDTLQNIDDDYGVFQFAAGRLQSYIRFTASAIKDACRLMTDEEVGSLENISKPPTLDEIVDQFDPTGNDKHFNMVIYLLSCAAHYHVASLMDKAQPELCKLNVSCQQALEYWSVWDMDRIMEKIHDGREKDYNEILSILAMRERDQRTLLIYTGQKMQEQLWNIQEGLGNIEREKRQAALDAEKIGLEINSPEDIRVLSEKIFCRHSSQIDRGTFYQQLHIVCRYLGWIATREFYKKYKSLKTHVDEELFAHITKFNGTSLKSAPVLVNFVGSMPKLASMFDNLMSHPLFAKPPQENQEQMANPTLKWEYGKPCRSVETVVRAFIYMRCRYEMCEAGGRVLNEFLEVLIRLESSPGFIQASHRRFLRELKNAYLEYRQEQSLDMNECYLVPRLPKAKVKFDLSRKRPLTEEDTEIQQLYAREDNFGLEFCLEVTEKNKQVAGTETEEDEGSGSEGPGSEGSGSEGSGSEGSGSEGSGSAGSMTEDNVHTE